MFLNFATVPLLSYILLGIAVLLTVLVCVVYVRRITRVSRYAIASRRAADDSDTVASHNEPASIIVFVQDDAEGLRRLLPQLLTQEYPSDYEVIVVNEGESQATREVVDELRPMHPNLYLTFTPDGARNLSRKKLGLMLGIKAARYRVVVHTVSSASIESKHWLSSMMRNFADPDIEVVLGYSAPTPGDDKLGCRTRAFDWTAQGVTWLSAAIAGKPYRGTEYNLAYTRDAFFNNKGFSRSINMHYGDDDIFVSELCRNDNTAVELSHSSLVRCRFGSHRRGIAELKRRHEFTGRFIRRGPRRVMALGVLMSWLAIGACAAAAIVSLPNLMATIYSLIVLIILLTAITLSWRGALVNLGSRRLLLTIPYLALTAPFRNMMTTLRGRLRHGRNYTWN